jgi:hypothetical protein
VDRTHNLHYETFRCVSRIPLSCPALPLTVGPRCRELSSLAAIDEGKPTIPNKNPLAVIEDEARVHRDKVGQGQLSVTAAAGD